jgi:Uma2 family endonuclease
MGLPKAILTEGEYLRFERGTQERHQNIDGEIFAMAGESWAHGSITVNIVGALVPQLGDGPCKVRVANTKMRSGALPRRPRRPGGLYAYPDVYRGVNFKEPQET